MTKNEQSLLEINKSPEDVDSLKNRRFELDFELQKELEHKIFLEEEVKKLEQQHANVKQRYNREQNLKSKNKKELQKITRSRSWKLSLPIRKIGALIKGKNQYEIDITSKVESISKPKVSDKNRNLDSKYLESKLWGGFSDYALTELINIKNSSHVPVNERMRATRVLSRWYYDQGDYQKAFDQLEYINEVKPIKNPSPDRTITEIKVMKKLGEINLAKRRIWNVIEARGLMSELCLGMAHLAENDNERINWYNLIYGRFGYNLVEKIDESIPLDLENIKTARTKVDSELEKYKISIIIPAYNSADLIHIAIESLLNQTLQNIEIIVVDDCSPDNTADVVEQYAVKDNRIKLIRKEINEGAYAARNTGLQQATGDFITIHDGDDWSHSQKLETQLKAILYNPGSVASVSYLVRASKDTTPLNAGSLLSMKFTMMNSSSLLVNKVVFNKIGGWDSVRVAGDTEFIWRIEKAYGDKSVIRVEPKVPFSIALSNESSLTGTSTTHVKTIRFGLRRTYREAFTWWHKKTTSPDQMFMDPKKINRHFPCPVPNRVRKPLERDYSVVFIADFTLENSINDLKAFYSKLEIKNNVAIFHWPFYEANPDFPIIDEIFQFIDEEEIDILVPNEELNAKQVVVINPDILKYSLDSAPIITTSSSFIVQNKAFSDDQKSLMEGNLRKTLNLNCVWRSTEDLLDLLS